MKAWVLQGVDDLRWETVEEPILAKGEVLLQVKAAGPDPIRKQSQVGLIVPPQPKHLRSLPCKNFTAF